MPLEKHQIEAQDPYLWKEGGGEVRTRKGPALGSGFWRNGLMRQTNWKSTLLEARIFLGGDLELEDPRKT